VRFPRLPWQKRDSDAEEGEDMGRGYTGEQWDDTDVDAEETETDETPDELAELADLDDEALDRVKGIIAKREAAAVAARDTALRSSFQERGFDIGLDGTPVISDVEKVASFAGSLRPAPAKPEPAPKADTADVDDDTIPDPYTQPKEFKAWLTTQNKAAVQAALTELSPRLERTEAFQMSLQDQRSLERVQQLLPNTPIAQLAAPEYRESFSAEFLQMVRTVPPDQRTDDLLLQAAGATITKVVKKSPQPKDERGRWASPDAANSLLYRESHMAHPDGQRAPRNPPPTEGERQAAARYGMTVSEARMLSSEPGQPVTLADYRAAQKLAEKERGRK
jgi:hypothetical protein